MTVLVEHADALREIVSDLSTLSTQQVVAMFRQYGDDRTQDEMATLTRAALPELITPHVEASGLVTAQWYDELNPISDYRATPVPAVDLLDPGRIERTTGWAFYAPGEGDPVTRLSGAVQRMVFEASRDTVTTNVEEEGVVGWARHAQPDACSFCRMLATRTSEDAGLYRSAESATRVVGRSIDLTAADRRMRAAGLASTAELLDRRATYSRGARAGQTKVRAQRGSRPLGEKYHDFCRCVAVPVRAGGYEPPEYVQAWEQQYVDAVKAAQADGKTRGEYGAIDPKAVLSKMRKADGGDAKGRHDADESSQVAGGVPRSIMLSGRGEAQKDMATKSDSASTSSPNAPGNAGRSETITTITAEQPEPARGGGRGSEPPGRPPVPPQPPQPPSEPGPDDDRERYRSTPPAERVADTRYADPVGDVVDAIAANPADRSAEVQLAADLSGRYGPHTVVWSSAGDSRDREVVLDGTITTASGKFAGQTVRSFKREDGYLIVDNDLLDLEPSAQRQGFSAAFYDALDAYYERSGVDLTRVHASLGVGGYAWARRGFDWNPKRLGESFSNIRTRIRMMLGNPTVSAGDKRILQDIADLFDENDPGGGWPIPSDLARLSGDDAQLGRTLMLGSSWYGIFVLSEKGEDYGT